MKNTTLRIDDDSVVTERHAGDWYSINNLGEVMKAESSEDTLISGHQPKKVVKVGLITLNC